PGCTTTLHQAIGLTSATSVLVRSPRSASPRTWRVQRRPSISTLLTNCNVRNVSNVLTEGATVGGRAGLGTIRRWIVRNRVYGRRSRSGSRGPRLSDDHARRRKHGDLFRSRRPAGGGVSRRGPA